MIKITKNSSDEFITTMEGWFKKAPVLPIRAKEILVMVTPWFALVFGILGILSSIAGIGVITYFYPAMLGGAYKASYGAGVIVAIIWLISSILLLAAFTGTKAKKIRGWKFLFWSEVVHFIGSLIALSIISGIIWAIISFYLLFQIKSYYK